MGYELSFDLQIDLSRPFAEHDIKGPLFSIPNDKSSGSMGSAAAFSSILGRSLVTMLTRQF